jgi:hypothetical protein
VFFYEIKTNQAWAGNTPLKIWRISKNGKRELVKENELAPLKESLDDLLCLAEAPRNDRTRKELLISLNRATAALSLRPLPPANLVKKLEVSIEQTSDLLGELKKYRGSIDISNTVHKIGAGVVNVLPVISENFSTVSLTPVSGTALIRMQALLRAWHDSVKQLRQTQPNAPNDDVTREIVRYAVDFSWRHSAKKPSAYQCNPVQRFAKSFLERITGIKRKKSLNWHIKKVLAEVPASARRNARNAARGKSPKKAD